jgi:mono/diheme cytochrome c family protein
MTRLFALLACAGTAAAAVPTFNQDIAPILYQNCATCHRPGEVAPFSLLTYQDAAKRARLIAQVTERRFMPPWKPEPGYGDFAHERRLTNQQIATIREWAEMGAPEGDGPAPPAPVFASGWQGGEPDAVLKFPEEFRVRADGRDQFQCFILRTNFDQDVYIGGAEFRPGNPRVVHHALVFLDINGQARQLAGGGNSYPCFGGARVAGGGLILGWAPGAIPLPVEPGISRVLPKGADIVVQIHYHPSGKPETDQSSLGLHLTGPPTKGVAMMIVLNRNIYIPPGESNYVVRASMTMPQDGELWGITPHAHYLGKEMKVNARFPDGAVKPLIWIKDWDFNWQGQYRYKNPILLPKGTRIEMEYSYDNSAANPQNPSNPPIAVRWGEQTTDEMALVFLGIVLPSPEDVRPFQLAVTRQLLEDFVNDVTEIDELPPEVPPAAAQRLRLALRVFDRNGDGRLDDPERAALRQTLESLLPR